MEKKPGGASIGKVPVRGCKSFVSRRRLPAPIGKVSRLEIGGQAEWGLGSYPYEQTGSSSARSACALEQQGGDRQSLEEEALGDPVVDGWLPPSAADSGS